MTSLLWLVAGLASAQFGGAGTGTTPEEAPTPAPAASKIVAVTVYQGQALVTREVRVPEGPGVVEVVVTPMPAATVENSLYTEGGDGLRVLSTRFRTRAVRADTRADVRAVNEEIQRLGRDAERIKRAISVQGENLLYLEKLERFTAGSLASLTEKGRLDDGGIIHLSEFVMESRATKARAEVDLRQELAATTAATEFARRRLSELASGGNRSERDAVIVIQKTSPEAGTVRLGHLVGSATWSPQYRLRGTTDDAPVRLESLAAVVQQTGEAWPDVRLTLSTARPSLDAAPPDLLPLEMDIPGASRSRAPVSDQDDQSRRINAELDKPIEMAFPRDTPLAEVVRYVRQSTSGPAWPNGIPIYVDPQGLQDADKTIDSTVSIDLHGVALRVTLRLLLQQLSLTYQVADGLLTITSVESQDTPANAPRRGHMIAMMGGGMGGMGGGLSMALEQAQAAGAVALLNRDAAAGQAEEMRVGDDSTPGEAVAATASELDGPSVSLTVEGTLSVPSRRDPQLLEVGRVDLPAEYFAKAVPVLTPRVYRLARLTNTSDRVLLPGEATVYIGTEFVGRMKLPLVAAGEPFVAGFGVDPQVQVSRRLVRKNRTIQGGNQVFTYEFRLNLRNYRAQPVAVQLWDRLPTPEAEAIAVNLAQTSTPLSTDPIYEKTGRADNLLRWDLDVPAKTVGDHPLSVTYEFRLEYARDLPQPRFLSGGLGEAPIGGPAVGGMSGMGGFQSVGPREPR